MKFDLAIIGAGPGGYNAAQKAAQNGLSVVLFEKENIGGVCLNEGCIPTKSLLYSAKQLDQAKAANKYGVTIEGEINFDLNKIVKRKSKIVRKLVAGINAGLKAHNVEVIKGEAFIKEETPEEVIISCNDEHYYVKNIIISTGSSTFIPPIDNLSNIDYWTSKEALNITDLPESLTIIGGGVIGIEFASYFSSLGVQVNVVEALEGILMNMDREMVTMLQAELEKKGIKFFLSSRVKSVKENEVIIEKDGTEESISSTKILVSVGRKPNIDKLGLINVGVNTQHGTILVNDQMQTSNSKIFAIGDATGKMMLAHTAIRGGEVAVNHLLGIKDAMTYNAVPAVVYTNPELAATGASEKELITKGISYKTHQISMTFSGRFVAENELGSGICKVIVDENGIVIGCHLLGNPASEIISIATMAIESKMTLAQLQRIILPHPTVTEILHEITNILS